MKVFFLLLQEVLPYPGAAVGGLLHRPSDCSHPWGGHRWEHESLGCFCSCVMAFPANDLLALVGKYGSNIRAAFWRNVPFFVLPFWAAFLLFRRPRVMPITTADKVTFRRLSQCLTVIQHVWSMSKIIYCDQMEAVPCCLDCSGAEEESPVSACWSAPVASVTRSCGLLGFQRICE